MTALTVEYDRAVTGGTYRRLPSASGAKPFVGSALSYGSGGYVHVLVAGEPFAGFCVETIQDKDKASADNARYIDAVGGIFVAVLPITVTVADIGRRVYATDDATFSFTQAGASTAIGKVVGVESSSKAIVLCQTQEVRHQLSYSLVGPGSALTGSSTRTALASWTIKAGTLQVGSRIRVRAQAIATATNSTDTLTLDIGGAVSGTPAALVASTATDVANSDMGMIDADIVIRTIGASGTLAGCAYVSTLAASGTAAPVNKLIASTTIDTTADFVLGFYGTWSTTSGSNSCRADVFDVDLNV